MVNDNERQNWWRQEEERKAQERAQQAARVQEFYDAKREYMLAGDRLSFLRVKAIHNNTHRYDRDIEAIAFAEMSGEFLQQVTIVQQAWCRTLAAELALHYAVVVNQAPKPGNQNEQ